RCPLRSKTTRPPELWCSTTLRGDLATTATTRTRLVRPVENGSATSFLTGDSGPMPGHFDLDKRVALVTGASRGLGFAMAEALGEAGATVVLNGRDADTLKPAADRLRERGLKAETSAFDVTDRRAVDAAIQSIVAQHRRLDILIANAGVTHRAPLADWTPEAWDDVLNVNLKACFLLAQQAAAPMRSQRYRRIIFTTSLVA